MSRNQSEYTQGTDLQDTDHLSGYRTATAGGARRWTWALIKSTLKTYFDNLYAPSSHTHASTAISDSTAAGRALLTAADVAAQKTALSLAKGDVGLGNVDNTSDANKPISTATQTALDGKASTSHNHEASALTSGNLTAARNSLLTYRAVVGTSDILALTDAFLGVDYQSGSATAGTVPPNSDVAFVIGHVVHLYQSGAGQVTITPGSGVTIRSRGGALKLAGQYARATLEKVATDTWVASGDLTT